MKILNTLKELLDYMDFCPLCQQKTRAIQIAVGPTTVFALNSIDRSNDHLTLVCTIRIRSNSYQVKYNIDCLTNSFEMELSDPTWISAEEEAVNKANSAHFYFYLLGNCGICNNCYLSSSEIEIDLLEKKVGPFSVYRESFYLLRNEKDKFHISLQHGEGTMLLSRCFIDEEESLIDDNKVFEYPLINFDFTDYDKVINKIKTIVLFS
jgi:hypothetical protein